MVTSKVISIMYKDFHYLLLCTFLIKSSNILQCSHSPPLPPTHPPVQLHTGIPNLIIPISKLFLGIFSPIYLKYFSYLAHQVYLYSQIITTSREFFLTQKISFLWNNTQCKGGLQSKLIPWLRRHGLSYFKIDFLKYIIFTFPISHFSVL